MKELPVNKTNNMNSKIAQNWVQLKQCEQHGTTALGNDPKYSQTCMTPFIRVIVHHNRIHTQLCDRSFPKDIY